jgi:hypothetical protein
MTIKALLSLLTGVRAHQSLCRRASEYAKPAVLSRTREVQARCPAIAQGPVWRRQNIGDNGPKEGSDPDQGIGPGCV